VAEVRSANRYIDSKRDAIRAERLYPEDLRSRLWTAIKDGDEVVRVEMSNVLWIPRGEQDREVAEDARSEEEGFLLLPRPRWRVVTFPECRFI
jgi:hypothetical protein